MILLYKHLVSIFSPAERKKWLTVLLLSCASALMDIAGVASVIPFLAILSNPQLIEVNPLAKRLFEFGHFNNVHLFLLALGIFSFFMLLLSAAVRSGSLYAQYAFSGLQRETLSCKLLEGYLSQNYDFFLSRHSGEMGRNVLSEVDQFIERALTPFTTLISSLFVLSAMAALIIIVDPISAFVVALVLGTAYALIFSLVRSVLLRLGEERLEANRLRFEIATEVFGGIKMIKALGREPQYAKRFRGPSHRFAKNVALSSIIFQLPKFVVETVAFGGILILSIVLILKQDGLSGAIPILGLYALSGYRMLPAVQNIYNSLTQLRFAGPAIAAIRRELSTTENTGSYRLAGPTFDPISSITLANVTYHHSRSTGSGITDVSVDLKRGTTLGIVGSTGAGKTTFVDVFLGLLQPHSGVLSVNGIAVNADNVVDWRAMVGYVPQEIFLADASIAENIAFGIPAEEIDIERVRRSAQLAQISTFIETKLPNGYDERVGERGVRLSGGQRQRIGIARALYNDPQVIVFDEATSNLDNLTEIEVMEALNAMAGIKTLIVVAHRLTTVSSCDMVLVLEDGRTAGLGTYEELTQSNGILRRLQGAQASPTLD